MGRWHRLPLIKKGTNMKTVVGLKALIEMRNSLPNVGWIFVDTEVDKTSLSSTLQAKFYIPENDEDEFFGEDNLMTWLEAPTFSDILTLRDKNMKMPTVEQYGEAALHYLKMDDFLE